MKETLKPVLFSLLIATYSNHQLFAGNVFIDPVNGSDAGNGTLNAPVATLGRAMTVANGLTGDGPIALKLFPGLHLLTDKITIKSGTTTKDAASFTIEAMVMPDDKDWTPDKMPVIQSVSANNSDEQFPHAVGFLVASDRVAIRGLKFIGNPNPKVKYYYPVTRENESLRGMQVSQCYFISEKHSTPIQGGIWAHGPETDINHCVFYNCRNAILLFKSVSGFSITHTVVYGANESAIWMGPIDSGFVFNNNVIAKSHCFWVRPKDSKPAYEFADSLIAETGIYMGYYTQNGVVEMPAESNIRFNERNLVRAGNVRLVEKTGDVLPRNYLNLTPESDGYAFGAGIFRKKP